MTELITPQVSVVIASHRPSFLGDLLSALEAQSCGRETFEVVAVCDYQSAGIRSKYPRVNFHSVNDTSISKKRNAGVRLAAAGIVAFIDDDCVPAPDWVRQGLSFLDGHPEFAAVEGLTTIENTDYSPPSTREYRRLERPGLRTNNIFYRKKTFQEAGGFDERFSVQREDLDLAFSVLERGFLIGTCADIRVMHRVRRNEPWDLLKNCWNRRFDPLLHKKHRRRYREFVGSPFPPSFLVLLGFHAVAVCLTLAAFPFFPAAALCDALAVSAAARRRCGRSFAASVFLREWVSCFLAPLLLLAALLYGSCRCRSLLLV